VYILCGNYLQKTGGKQMEKSKVAVEKNDSASLLLVAVIFILATVIALTQHIPIVKVMNGYPYNVIVILIIMEFYTNLIVSTGIMQYFATKLATNSKGNKRRIMVLFGSMMFIISPFINNITSVMIILPVIFVLLKAIDIDRKFIYTFFAMILAVSNTGGASSPIGDFPAIVIMTSGISTFMDYLFRAMPLFVLTSIALITYWTLSIKKDTSKPNQEFAVQLLHSQYKYILVDTKTLIPLCIIFFFMFVAWSFVPPDIIPPEIVAVLGYVIATVICTQRGKNVNQTINFKAILTIASFLFLASVIGATGILVQMAEYLQGNISDPRLLLLAIMVITSIVSGLFSAGPASAAMMPIIINLSNTSLAAQSHWVAIAYASAICAGSSLFLWSATAGFILSGKIATADLGYKWGIGAYLRYGLINYLIQMTIAIIAIAIIV
jgi:Na+/H+ antiporter NhaD/arsenite permease-like protein